MLPLTILKQRALTSFYQRKARIPNGSHLITFTFDDFNTSAYRIGGKILVAAGARGTFYAAMGLMNTGNDLFTNDDVAQLLEMGHDLQCHTYSHLSSRQHSLEAYRADIERGKAAIAALRDDGHCAHFAYPYGHVTLPAKRELQRIFVSCRGIADGINSPVVDLNLLRANQLYSGSVSLVSVKEQIERARREKGWLIFYTHDIASTPTRYGCTPTYFEEAVRSAVESGARIVTVSEAVRLLSPVYR